MSKKRFGDLRLEGMDREQLLAYAKRITRDHGRAQESINRLRTRLEQLEGAHQAPHQEPHRTAPVTAPGQHRRLVLRDSGEASRE